MNEAKELFKEMTAFFLTFIGFLMAFVGFQEEYFVKQGIILPEYFYIGLICIGFAVGFVAFIWFLKLVFRGESLCSGFLSAVGDIFNIFI